MTLVFSGGELGYIEPCGCSEGQLGGIARRDSLLTQMRTQGKALVLMANGNLISDASPQSALKADIGFFALADMEYIAYNVGERDVQFGIAQLITLSEENELPLVSANLYQGASPVFMPYLLHTQPLLNGVIKIALVGLISPNYAVYAQNADVQILEPTVILEALVPELTETADVIVCLFNGTASEAAVLAENFPVLDIVVVSTKNTEGAPASSSIAPRLVNTEIKGKSVCSLKIHQDIAGQLIVADSQRHLLDEQIPDSQRMTELLALYEQMVAAGNLAESTPRKQQDTGPEFAGTATCKTCHIGEWTSWQETKHAHAYHTLEVAGHETDPECLTCHTVGFGFSSGFLSIEETPHHLDVGCENCHGAGSTHAKQESRVSNPASKGYGAVTNTTCLTCHTTANSPKFELKEYFPKIVHTLEAHP